MRPLFDSLLKSMNMTTCDGHIHLFDYRGEMVWKMPKQFQTIVGFMDIVFSQPEMYKTSKQVVGYYENYFNTHTPKCNEIILATGTTAKQAIDVYKRFPKQIKGFGEFKCYDKYINAKTGEEIQLEFGNLDWIRPVFEFDMALKLPIYIHFDLRNKTRVKELTELLEDFPMVPVVLCHCGMSKRNKDNDETFINVCGLMSEFQNLYVDISYDALNYFIVNQNKLLQLPPNRIFIGSDINLSMKKLKGPMDIENEYKKMMSVSRLIPNNDINIKTLFKI